MLPKPSPAPKPRRHRDPVTPAVYAAVRRRDKGCVSAFIPVGMGEGVFPDPCIGPLELDHVWSGGLGMRGPSTPWNLVTLCRAHHLWKTEHARDARRALKAYLERFYGPIDPRIGPV